MIQLNCPVCDRSGISSDICPNCETNLSTFRLLAELPPISSLPTFDSTLKIWLCSTILVVFFLGISLGATGSSLLSQHSSLSAISGSQAISINQSGNNMTSKSMVISPASCLRNAYYRVLQGDSISKIARQFYGNSDTSKLIVQSNIQLSTREKDLDLDEQLLLPIIYRACD
jgi:hypothetical protein